MPRATATWLFGCQKLSHYEGTLVADLQDAGYGVKEIAAVVSTSLPRRSVGAHIAVSALTPYLEVLLKM